MVRFAVEGSALYWGCRRIQYRIWVYCLLSTSCLWLIVVTPSLLVGRVRVWVRGERTWPCCWTACGSEESRSSAWSAAWRSSQSTSVQRASLSHSSVKEMHWNTHNKTLFTFLNRGAAHSVVSLFPRQSFIQSQVLSYITYQLWSHLQW